MAGSLGLNKRFAQAVKNIVGEDQYFHLRKETGFQQAMNQFDKNIKTAFRGDLDEDYYVNFPMANLIDDHAYRLMANCWNMKGGAVLSQLPQEAAITSTVATKHYGVSANAAYDRREDAGQEVIIDKYTGKKQVSKVRLSCNYPNQASTAAYQKTMHPPASSSPTTSSNVPLTKPSNTRKRASLQRTAN
ncbi:MAG: hypothetical protein Q9198_009115 [Flavoplaca austrocitrina]